MANCSIPNSSPASGRISTRSLRRSRRQNSQPIACTSVNRGWWLDVQKRRQVRHVESLLWPRRIGALKSALRARKIRRRTLDRLPRFSFYGVERWEFSAVWRVKGAWWPSRSSKPPSPRKWRGRFDSYPLRQLFSRHPERSAAKSKDPVAISTADSSRFLDFARNDKLIERG